MFEAIALLCVAFSKINWLRRHLGYLEHHLVTIRFPMMKVLTVLSSIGFFLLLSSCSDEVATEKEAELESCGERCWIFNHDGMRRSYYLYQPDNLPPNPALLFVLHGYTDMAQRLSTSTLDLNQMADEKGYAIVYPQGSRDRLNTTHWNAELDANQTETDDIGFLSELALFLQSEYGFDPSRTLQVVFQMEGL